MNQYGIRWLGLLDESRHAPLREYIQQFLTASGLFLKGMEVVGEKEEQFPRGVEYAGVDAKLKISTGSAYARIELRYPSPLAPPSYQEIIAAVGRYNRGKAP